MKNKIKSIIENSLGTPILGLIIFVYNLKIKIFKNKISNLYKLWKVNSTFNKNTDPLKRNFVK